MSYKNIYDVHNIKNHNLKIKNFIKRYILFPKHAVRMCIHNI